MGVGLGVRRQSPPRELDELIRYTSVAVADSLPAFRDLVVADETIVWLYDQLATRFLVVKNATKFKIHVVRIVKSSANHVAPNAPSSFILPVWEMVRGSLYGGQLSSVVHSLSSI